MTEKQKETLKKELVDLLKEEHEIKKIILFGSFMNSEEPEDMDIAVLQDSNKTYLELAMKYRKLTRALSKKIPFDIIPLKELSDKNVFLKEIAAGEVIYER